MNRGNNRIALMIAAIVCCTLACQALTKKLVPTIEIIPPELPEISLPTLESIPTLEINPTEALQLVTEIPLLEIPTIEAILPVGEFSQWAFGAQAGSHYGDGEDWSEIKTTGKPDTPECGDFATAWASADANSSDWIELYYEKPVIPTRVNIYQTYNPNQVVKVTLKTESGEEFLVYDQPPKIEETCPFNLSIPVGGVDQPVVSVTIELDQTMLNLGWNEIDAVELVGKPQDASFIPPVFSMDDVIFFPAEILPVNSFYYEIFGDLANDAVTDSLVTNPSDDDSQVTFTLSRDNETVSLTFYLPANPVPGTYQVIQTLEYGDDSPKPEGMQARVELFIRNMYFLSTQGAVRIDSFDNGVITGSFEVTLEHDQLPGNTVDVLGAFNQVKIK